MKIKFLKLAAVFLTGASLLSSCASTPGADQILLLSESVQRQAHLQCQYEQGLNIPEAIDVLELRDGRVLVSVTNGPGLPLSKAREINMCARGKMLSQPSSVNAKHVEGPSSEQTAKTTSRPQRDTQQDYVSSFGCVAGRGVMQGGASICPRKPSDL